MTEEELEHKYPEWCDAKRKLTQGEKNYLKEKITHGFTRMKEENPKLLAETLANIGEDVNVSNFEAWLDSKFPEENTDGK